MEKQTWLVTGGSSDVATALFDELDERLTGDIDIYAQYFMHSIDEKWKRLNIIPVYADLSLSADVDKLIDTVTSKGENITHIIHLAAIPYESVRLKEWNEDRVNRQMQVGLYSFAKICKAIVPEMGKRRSGCVFVMLTDAIKNDTVPASICEYVSVKSALKGYTEALIAEYSSKNVDVHMAYPSMMETKFLKNINPRIIELDAESRPGGTHMTTKEFACSMLELIL